MRERRSSRGTRTYTWDTNEPVHCIGGDVSDGRAGYVASELYLNGRDKGSI